MRTAGVKLVIRESMERTTRESSPLIRAAHGSFGRVRTKSLNRMSSAIPAHSPSVAAPIRRNKESPHALKIFPSEIAARSPDVATYSATAMSPANSAQMIKICRTRIRPGRRDASTRDAVSRKAYIIVNIIKDDSLVVNTLFATIRACMPKRISSGLLLPHPATDTKMLRPLCCRAMPSPILSYTADDTRQQHP